MYTSKVNDGGVILRFTCIPTRFHVTETRDESWPDGALGLEEEFFTSKQPDYLS